MHILIVEDDEVARDYLAKALREVGHTVDVAANGLDGLHMASSIAVDLAIVDRMLPKLDGLALVQSLRARGRKMPVLILRALGDVDDRITGLRPGGEDYLTKPYHMSELLARIDALARRGENGSAEANTRLKLADLELDRMTRRVMRNGKKIELTAREFQLLEFMMRHSGQVVTRTMLLEGVWDYHFDPQTNVIEAEVQGLREQMLVLSRSDFIELIEQRSQDQDVRGAVYLMVDPQLRPVAGNVPAWPKLAAGQGKWFLFKVSVPFGDETREHEMRAQRFPLPGGYRMLVGHDVQERQDVKNLMMRGLIAAVSNELPPRWIVCAAPWMPCCALHSPKPGPWHGNRSICRHWSRAWSNCTRRSATSAASYWRVRLPRGRRFWATGSCWRKRWR